MDLITQFSSHIGANLQLTLAQYRVLIAAWSILKRDNRTLLGILDGIIIVTSHRRFNAKDLHIFKHVLNLQVLDIAINVYENNCSTLYKFLHSHPSLKRIAQPMELRRLSTRVNIPFDIEWVLDTLKQICTIYKGDLNAKGENLHDSRNSIANRESVEISNELAIYSRGTIDMQLHNTKMIKCNPCIFEHYTPLTLFDRTLYPSYDRLKRVFEIEIWNPVWIPVSSTMAVGDIINSSCVYRIHTPSILRLISNMNLVGEHYVLPFDIEDVKRMLINGRKFKSIGIFVNSTDMQEEIDAIDVENKFLFFPMSSMMRYYPDYKMPIIDFEKM